MEIEFFHENLTEKDLKLLMEHIQRMAYGEAPLFATTLSSVYDKLVEKTFAQPIPSGSGLGKSVEVQNVAVPRPPLQASTSISGFLSTSTSGGASSSSSQVPALNPGPGPVPSSISPPFVWLRCSQCSRVAGLGDLYNGLRCPQCQPRNAKKGRPYMECPKCRVLQTEITHGANCLKKKCKARFV